MDRNLSPSLNIPCYFPLNQTFEEPCAEEDFNRMGTNNRDLLDRMETRLPNLKAALFRLSHLFCQLCIYHRQGDLDGDLQKVEQQYVAWFHSLHGGLVYSETNFDIHQKRGSLRQFLYLHLLYHHVGQLLYFPSLQGGDQRASDLSNNTSRVRQCHYHANRITEIVENGWTIAGIDIHNMSCGQVLTVAASIHMHACLTATSIEQREAHQVSITTVTDSFMRVREHCRVFDRIVCLLHLLEAEHVTLTIFLVSPARRFLQRM
jgi:hypothetical protein